MFKTFSFVKTSFPRHLNNNYVNKCDSELLNTQFFPNLQCEALLELHESLDKEFQQVLIQPVFMFSLTCNKKEKIEK